MKKIKLYLFDALEKLINFFSKIGVNKKTPGVSWIYSFLFKKTWPYGNIIEVQGSKMYVNIHDESSEMRKTFKVYASNLIHERATTELFRKTVKERDMVVDLGANIGYFTLLAARLVGPEGKVFSFEPEPKNYSYLIKNVKLNNYNQVVVLPKAVSNKDGKTRLYICDYDTGHHTINKYDGIESYSRGRKTEEHSIEIETVTLDNFLEGKTNRVDIIKMDVEGAEALALAGMDNILRKNRKIKMFIEFFPLLIEKMGSSSKDFISKLLKDYQFSIYVIPDDYDAKRHEMLKVASVEEIIGLCQKKEDHVNLFLKRDNGNKINNKEN
jgi:FkbM family methyltransferase